MKIIQFPAQRVIEINRLILKNGQGLRGGYDLQKLEGALGRIDNSIVYEGLEDVFLIAAKYAVAIAKSHAFSDANKRTGFAVCMEYLSLNDYELEHDYEALAEVMVGLVIGSISETDFANTLYAVWLSVESETDIDWLME